MLSLSTGISLTYTYSPTVGVCIFRARASKSVFSVVDVLIICILRPLLLSLD